MLNVIVIVGMECDMIFILVLSPRPKLRQIFFVKGNGILEETVA